ncbi:hypothetical protein [Candidatus Hodgkinia cicadicola]
MFTTGKRLSFVILACDGLGVWMLLFIVSIIRKCLVNIIYLN